MRGLNDAAAVSLGRRRSHGFGGWRSNRATNRRQRTRHRRAKREPAGAENDTKRHRECEIRKAEVLVIERADGAPHPCPDTETNHDACSGDRERELDIMPAERKIAVAKRLERSNLRA